MADHKSDAEKEKRDGEEEKIFCSFGVCSKDDSFINDHLIPKKANDDRRRFRFEISEAKGNWITKLNQSAAGLRLSKSSRDEAIPSSP